MTEVFNIDKLPSRRLSVRAMISLNTMINIGEAVRMAKRKMAMQLSEKIINEEAFFWSRIDKVVQYSTVEYGADCIILTQEEYMQLKRSSFKEGIEHATGFMPSINY